MTVQKKAVPIVVVLIVGMILFDMRDQTAVPVAKVLSALVIIGFSVHCKINAELCFIVAGNILVGCVKICEKGICACKGQLFVLL